MHYYWDKDDPILKAWVQGIGAEYLPYEEIIKTPVTNPISFRSLAKRKVIYESLGNKRPFYYIDTGYVGNLIKKKLNNTKTINSNNFVIANRNYFKPN